MAANIDAAETAKNYGIDADHAVDYLPDAGGTDQVYAAMSMAIGNVRRGARLKEDRSWRKNADVDYQKRKK